MKLNIVGNIFGTSGFAIHTINVAKALLEEGVDVGLETQLIPDWQASDFREQIEKDYSYENTLMITTPEWWPIKSGDRLPKFVGYGIFEGTCIPPYWTEICNKGYVNKIIVPSKHAKEAFAKGGVEPDKIIIIPHGIDPKIFYPKKVTTTVTNFKFLFVGGWKTGPTDRKGLDIALRAFCDEFKPEEPVEFFVKLNMAYQPQQLVLQNLESLKLPMPRPKISLNFDNLPSEKLGDLYRESDCFVMPTKGESFCMPCLEALACGIPVIATNYGGQTDYLPEEGLIKVERMIPATAEPWIYDWAEWGIPDQKHLQELMRKAFNKQLKPHPEIAKNYTWNHTAREIIKLF